MIVRSSETQKVYLNTLSKKILDAAMRVHTALGPGLLENAYQACLGFELMDVGLQVECQVPLPIQYRNVNLDIGYRVDMIVEKAILVELKAVEKVQPLHHAQVLSYLKMSGLSLGLLINFNVVSLKDGIQRLVYVSNFA